MLRRLAKELRLLRSAQTHVQKKSRDWGILRNEPREECGESRHLDSSVIQFDLLWVSTRKLRYVTVWGRCLEL
uniref:Uncharacterized protein n=1 Tax=Steinernema glaseri TaxID=37863 RepID=A0A1I7Y122_9BILA